MACRAEASAKAGAAGRIPTCIVPLRRRMPDVFGHDSGESVPSLEFRVPGRANQTLLETRNSELATCENWSARQDLHLRSPGSKPGMLLLHHALKSPDVTGKIGT